MNVGAKHNVEIIGASSDGDGIAKVDGIVVFVEGGLLHDCLEAEITEVKKNFARGKAVRLITPSPYRTEPKCPIERECGGCCYQALGYQAQVNLKKEAIASKLNRIGGFEALPEIEEVRMAVPYFYRNKAEYAAADKEGTLILGFNAAKTHFVVPAYECRIQNAANALMLHAFTDYASSAGLHAANGGETAGTVKGLTIRHSSSGSMLIIDAYANKLPNEEELIQRLREIGGMASVCLNDVRPQGSARILFGERKLVQKLGGLNFGLSPFSFFQINTELTEALFKKVVEYCAPSGDETIIDAYCGVGAISLFLARAAKRVYGIELSGDAINDAKDNAKLNGIENVSFRKGKSEVVFAGLLKEGVVPDAVVLDPPRRGCDASLVSAIRAARVRRVVYVSCDPATLARDLRFLGEGGYAIRRVAAVDMFAMTKHIETVALLELS